MRYQISGKHIDVGNALNTYVQSELSSVFEKFSQRPTDAHVVFSKS
ncbi:MAG: HPF/RaiA family ribosome-associated protein, partial [Pseudomonadota bacterium]